MSGRGEPPKGSRGGGPDGEDEFRVVFDESFVRAAVLHEPSAQERLRTGKGPRRLRRVLGVPAGVFRVGVLMSSVVLVLAAALYLGAQRGATTVHDSVYAPTVLVRVSLAPGPGVAPVLVAAGADPFAGTPAAFWSEGRAGILLPVSTSTSHFNGPQVQEALELARDFVTGTQLDPEVWGGTRPWAVALNLEADSYAQLTAALDHPVDDDKHAATGWVTRFDPQQIAVEGTKVRVSAIAAVAETPSGELVVTLDGVFVYAVQAKADAAWMRFVVHRAWEFRVDKAGLRNGKIRVRRIATVAAPQACDADSSAFFRPLFTAGTTAPATTWGTVAALDAHQTLGTLPATGKSCGVLSAAV
ncbi:SCO2583 family membrane protein [Yinghuangia soli]|uniref:Uncharacterized protein n=1 Tax=Yinghuangia soli TaxID=2908204 RepID=A0AA41U1D5_9ACTN|nr:hypothetical protein [Yinghuangia soli]MCF2530683.1 hypothetical protein [Yinghuangia soli]